MTPMAGAKRLIFLVTGREKAEALKKCLLQPTDPYERPGTTLIA